MARWAKITVITISFTLAALVWGSQNQNQNNEEFVSRHKFDEVGETRFVSESSVVFDRDDNADALWNEATTEEDGMVPIELPHLSAGNKTKKRYCHYGCN